LTADPERAGRPMTCPRCGEPIRVPAPPDASPKPAGTPAQTSGPPAPRWAIVLVVMVAVAAVLAPLALPGLLGRRRANDLLEWGGLAALAGLILLLIYLLGSLPGQIARHRRHPQAEAIRLCGWLGLLLTGGLGWVVAMVWAHTVSGKSGQP